MLPAHYRQTRRINCIIVALVLLQFDKIKILAITTQVYNYTSIRYPALYVQYLPRAAL